MAGSWKQLILANDSPTFAGLTVTDLIIFDGTDKNTKIGYQAGKNIVSGADSNVFVGYQAGLSGAVGGSNIADINNIVGYQAFYSNTTGQYNTALGGQALYANTTGNNNTAMGLQALCDNTQGSNNTAIGYLALTVNQTGNNNVALGYCAGKYETSSNAFYIDNQDRSNTAGDKAGALLYGVFNATPASQTLVINATVTIAQGLNGVSLDLTGGNLDLDNTTNANQYGVITKAGTRFIHDFNYGNNGTVTTLGMNVFIGSSAGNLTMGSGATQTYHASYNIGIGLNACTGITTGFHNMAIGSYALLNITSGYSNAAIGTNAGRYIADAATPNTTSYNSVYIGRNAYAKADGDVNETVIGFGAIGLGSNSVVIGNSSVTLTGLYGNVGINTVTFGTSATAVLGILNGTAPTTHVDNEIQIFSVDSSDATATLGLYLEQAVEAIGTFTASNKIKVKINGTEYWIELDAV